MRKLLIKPALFAARSRQYFSMSKKQIADDNAILLRYCSWAFCIFLLLYSILTWMLMPNRILIWCYLIFGAAAAGFLLFAERCCRAADKSYGVIRNACILFVCTILAYAISISVFPFPSQPAIFFPLSLVLVCGLFILPFYTMTFLLTGAFFVFLVLVLLFKTPRSISYDLFSGVTALILVYFLLYIITDLRLRSGESLVKLEVLNRTDPLTGLPNRRWASENMPPCFRRCQKMQLPVAAMMLDIDDFKKYNDTLGHQAGDTCLKIIGEIILSYSKDLGIRAARYGGEEFLFLLGDCSKKEALSAAWGLLERVRDRAIPGPDGSVTVSVGVAVMFPSMDSTMEELIGQADAALYHSKRIGKNQVTLAEVD